MLIAKVTQAKLIGSEVELYVNLKLPELKTVHFRCYLDGTQIGSFEYNAMELVSDFQNKILLPSHYEGKQLKIVLFEDTEILIYSKLLPVVHNKRRVELLAWVQSVEQNSKRHKNTLIGELTKLLDIV